MLVDPDGRKISWNLWNGDFSGAVSAWFIYKKTKSGREAWDFMKNAETNYHFSVKNDAVGIGKDDNGRDYIAGGVTYQIAGKDNDVQIVLFGGSYDLMHEIDEDYKNTDIGGWDEMSPENKSKLVTIRIKQYKEVYDIDKFESAVKTIDPMKLKQGDFNTGISKHKGKVNVPKDETKSQYMQRMGIHEYGHAWSRDPANQTKLSERGLDMYNEIIPIELENVIIDEY